MSLRPLALRRAREAVSASYYSCNGIVDEGVAESDVDMTDLAVIGIGCGWPSNSIDLKTEAKETSRAE